MELHLKKTIGIAATAALLLSTAGGANAKPDYSGITQPPHSLGGLLYAQASIGALSESDLRRLNFYTGRTLDALEALAAEDALSAGAGASQSSDSVGALREAIKRLVDAGKRSGVSQIDVADFFKVAAIDRFGQNIPLALQDASGNIDTRSLFSGVIGQSNSAAEQQTDVDYLAILQEESANLDLGIVTETDAETIVVEAPHIDQGPKIREGADAATISIIQRVEVDGDNWHIEVVSGDTLATFATAIYGDSLAYRQIFSANSDLLSNANSLVIGQVLTIPKP